MKEPKTYKLETQLIEKMEELASSSGLSTQNDFMEDMVRVYEMHRLKEGIGGGYASLLSEWEYHKNREYEIIVNIIESESAARLEITQEHEKVLAERSAAFFAQEQTIAEQTVEIKRLKEESKVLVKTNTEHEQLIEQLRDNQKKGDSLIEEYKGKIDTLSGLLNESKAAAAESKELAGQVAELQTSQDKHMDRIARLENDITVLEQQRQEQLEQQTERHEQELQQQQARLDVQRERDLVQLRVEYQNKIEKLSADARVSSEESTAEIRKLYSIVDSLREKAGAAKSTTSRKTATPKDEGKTQ
ncbi:hypothetical protein ASL14_26440 (plasmid) [Paenibacillus sp. IHB B 3084]|uniref:hypothetical protein n=1 Tax=Paenibacillus sp. IHB B 3084 TaxID=867076 RepID=UPI000720D9BC|nr:hypothetical protein [Paenibacillus sp. IHB B 3084]ALP39416.1 hypothetical protein ASL14_26440 [Paenibacillus sp. IHB B 3084]